MTGSSERRLAPRRMGALLAVTVVGSSVLGLVRDALTIRYLTFGAGSDEFFVGMAYITVFFGLAGQATYIPIALKSARRARRFLWGATSVFSAASTLTLLAKGAPAWWALTLGAAPYIGMALTMPKYVRLMLGGHAARIGLVPILANVIYIALLFAFLNLGVDISGDALSGHYGISLGASLLLLGLGVPERTITEAEPRGTNTYLIVCTAMQLYPLLERHVGSQLGQGANTLIAVGQKIASVPVGVLGYAIATATFITIASGRAPARSLSDTLRSARLWVQLLVLSAMLALASVVALSVALALPWIGPLVGIPGDTRMDERVTIALCTTSVPFAIAFAIITQELLAAGSFRQYNAVSTVFLMTFGLVAILALTFQEAAILAVTTPVSYLIACAATLCLRQSRPPTVPDFSG